MTSERDLDLERILDGWFALGADRAPEAAVERGIELAWATPQVAPLPPALGWRDVGAVFRAPAMRLAAALVLGLLTVIGVAAFIGSRPSVVTFTSPRYGYAVEVPSDWATIPAASEWRVTTAWDVEPVADVLRHGGLRFTAVSAPIIGAPRLERWAEVFVPDRAELSEPRKDPRCLDPAGVAAPLRIAAYRGWEPAVIGGHDARIRVACGYVDAVVVLRQRAYVLSMFTGRQALADLAAFDSIVRTIRFTPPTPSPAPPTPSPTPTAAATVEAWIERYTSPLYDYSIPRPASWKVDPAVEAWDGTGRVDGPRTADEFSVPRRMTITATELPASASVEAWIGEHVRLPSTYASFSPGQSLCRFGGTMMPYSGSAWREGTIGGRQAWIRAVCGTVDGVVAIGDRVFVVRYDSARRPNADEAAFQAIVDRIEFPDSAQTRPLEPDAIATFVSERFGYRVQVPWRWSYEPATRSPEELRPPGTPLVDPERDRLVDRVHEIVIASAPVAPGTTARAWVDEHAPRRQTTVGESPACRRPTGTVTGLPEESWRPMHVAGIDAVERDSCYVIDVVVVVGGRAYLISASSSAPAQTPAGSRAALDTVLEGITFTQADGSAPGSLEPEATVRFDSPRYGYRAEVPLGWAREPATRSAVDLLPGSLGPDSTFDRFLDGSSHIILAASAPVPDGTTASAWAEEHAPSRQTLDPGRDGWQCVGPNGGVWMHIPYASWRPWQVGGHEALARDSCFFMDVVVVVGDRVYLFTARSQAVIGISTAAPAYLDEFVGTLEFTPETAIDD